MVDASSILEFKGEKKPNVFNIMSALLVIFLIADIGFTGFRLGQLGVMVTAFLFLVTLIAAFGFTDNLLFTEGHPLSGNFAFTLGFLGLNIFNIIGLFNLSFVPGLSATQSYLSGVLGAEAGIIIPIVNLVFAPNAETFLIFLGFTAGLYSIVKRTSLSQQSMFTQFLIVSVPPSLFFSVLHGTRGFSFLVLSFSINMIWSAILFYGEMGRIPTDLIPVSTGLIVGLHMGFNTLNFGGVAKFFNTFVTGLSGQYSRSSGLILLFMFLNFGFALLYLYEFRESLEVF